MTYGDTSCRNCPERAATAKPPLGLLCPQCALAYEHGYEAAFRNLRNAAGPARLHP